MVDVEARMAALTPAHAAGLRRLSARASAPATASGTASHRHGLLSFASAAESVLAGLRAAGVPVLPGLAPGDLARLEAALLGGLPLPPDLRALLAAGVPAGDGFPDFRRPPRLDLPLAALSLRIARSGLWLRSWGPKPQDPDLALHRARSALRRSPILIPVGDRCYLPARPALAGNPVFSVDEDGNVSLAGVDLADFFRRRSSTAIAGGGGERAPRWIEFWSDATADHRRRSSSSSSEAASSSSSASSPARADPEQFVEIRPGRETTGWVGSYLDWIGASLRSGGWGESDVREIVHVPASPELFDRAFGGVESPGAVDVEAAMDALLLKAERCSDELRRAGWDADEVSDALGIALRRERRRQPPVRVPPEIALKVEKLVEAVGRS